MLDAGFLVVWNDIAPEVEAEYQRWHRVEHMAERMALPGFTLGRRYRDRGGSRYRYLTVYEGRSVETFRSEAYRARLAAPTPWTTRMSARMGNFIRRVCRTVASEGAAIGGADPFNAVLIVEGDSRAVLTDRLPELRRLLAKFVVDDKAIAAQVYDLALLFQASGGRN